MEIKTMALKQKLTNIRKINNECDHILNRFGIAYSDFPGRTNLDAFSELKNNTGLALLDLTYLQEWHCSKIEQNMPKKIVLHRLQYEVNELDYELLHVKQAIKACERFLEYAKGNTKLTAGVERLFEERRREYNLLLDRKNKLKTAKCIDLNEIVHKVESLGK